MKILRAQHYLREGIWGFARFMKPAFNGWADHRAWMHRTIEAEAKELRPPATVPATCVVQKDGTDRATVKEGATTLIIKGHRRVWLLLSVADARKHLSWDELVQGNIENASVVMDRRTRSRSASGQDNPSNVAGAVRRGARTPKFATQAKSLQNLGTRIRKDLGKLAYHWQQDGHGVVWNPDCQ